MAEDYPPAYNQAAHQGRAQAQQYAPGHHPWPQPPQPNDWQLVRHGHAPSAPADMQQQQREQQRNQAQNGAGPNARDGGPPVAIHFHNAVNANAVANADVEQRVGQVARLRSALVAKVRQSAGNPIVTAIVGAAVAMLLHNHTPILKSARS